jgi:cation diffusion facilitator family transporter
VADGAQASGGSRLTVLLALGANLGIAVLKAAAGLLTGSAALLSESAHSVGDTVTEALLLTALHRSAKPANRRHPFGYGKERYFWSLLAAVGIFVSGAVFSLYQGVHTITGGAREETRPWVNYLVLAISAGLEGTSFAQGLRELRAQARSQGVSARAYLREPRDTTVKSVVLEDSAALVGLLLAFAGVGLHQITGSALYDGLAALAIGVLLAVVAVELVHTNMGLLVGKQADARLIRGIRSVIEQQPEVEKLVDVLTMVVGTGSVLLCARVDFVDTISAAELERVCVRLDGELRARFSDLDELFLEPVPRNDPEVRARVLTRYGDLLDGAVGPEAVGPEAVGPEAVGPEAVGPEAEGGLR